jgi:hypothetical protein
MPHGTPNFAICPFHNLLQADERQPSGRLIGPEQGRGAWWRAAGTLHTGAPGYIFII